MTSELGIEVGTVYKIGDKIKTHTGVEATIPDGPLGDLIVAMKNYGNSIGRLVGASFFVDEDNNILGVNRIEFVTPEEAARATR